MAFFLRKWLRAMQRNAAPGAPPRCQSRRARPRRALLRLEGLEDRTVPSTLMVTSPADDGSAGTLRAVIAAANSGDTINFAPALAGQTIALTSGELAINKSLDIEGLGANQLTISGSGASRVFDITSNGADVTIAGLTVADGRAARGAGIDNHGILAITDSVLAENKAVGDAGHNG